MQKFLMAATAATAIFAATSANAMPAGSSNGVSVDSAITNVGLCFYVDGWNGPGMYDCGFRHNRGHGWHGKRHDGGNNNHGNKHSNKSHKGDKDHH